MEGMELLDHSIRRAKLAQYEPAIQSRPSPFADELKALKLQLIDTERRLDTLESVNDALAARLKFLDKMLNPNLEIQLDPRPDKIPGPTIDHIINCTAFHFHVSPEEIRGQRRHTTILTPRQVAMYLCRKLTFKSMPNIGFQFEGRDHTTVLHSVKKITARRVVDGILDEALAAIERAIKNTAKPAIPFAE